MREPEMPDYESERLNALMMTGLLDSQAEERFDRLTRLAKAFWKVPIALITLVDARRQWFKSAQGLDVSETPRSVSFCGHAILKEKIFCVQDASKDERFADNPLVTGAPKIRFYAGAPLKTRAGHIIGTLCVIDNQPRIFTQDDQQQLRDIADCVEAEINRAHLPEIDQEAARHLQNERRLKEIIENTRIATWEWNVQTGETIFNERWAEIVGYTLAELSPLSIDTWLNLAHPDDLAVSAGLLERHFNGELGFYDVECRMRHKLGHWVWVHDRGRVVSWTEAGQPLLMSGTHMEITDRKEAEEALIRSRDQYQALVSNIPGITYRCLFDADWTMLFMSDQIDPLSGYPASDFLNNSRRTYLSVIHPDDRVRIDEIVQEAVRCQRHWHCEYRILHCDGSIRWVQERGAAVCDKDGTPQYLDGFILDITSEIEAKEAVDRQIAALSALNKISSNPDLDIEQQLQGALAIASRFLQLELGIISRIEGQDYLVRSVSAPAESGLSPGNSFALGVTYCQLTLQSDDVLMIDEMGCSEFRDHPCYEAFSLESYIGLALRVNGRVYGTLNFSSARPRMSDFTESERVFMRLLGRWVSATLERDENQQHLSKLVAQVPGMVFQFQRWPDGRSAFPYSSPGIRNIYNLSPEDVRFDAAQIFAKIHPDDLQLAIESVDRSEASLEDWHLQFRVIMPDGSFRWVEGRSTPTHLEDGSTIWHGYISDIDGYKQASLALAASESRLRELFELSPIGIALNDMDSGDFVDLNEALLKPTGYTREEFIKLNYWHLTPEEYQPQERAALESLSKTGRYGPYEKEYIRKDGTRYPVLLNGMLVRDPNGRCLIWSMIEDISERKRIEKMKDEFVSTVSHELRTPLTSIAGSLGLLAGGVLGQLPDQAQKILEIARSNSLRLSYLINDLLDMDRLISGKMRFDFSEVELLPLVKKSLMETQSFASQYEVSLELTEPDRSCQIYVDPNRFQQILANLLSNAIKFSPPGGTVLIDITRLGRLVRVSITDQGAGIPAGFRSRIFQKFAQADGSDSRMKGGTGLGLAITHHLVEQMHGRISYHSIEGEGATFFVDFPTVSLVGSKAV